MGKVLTDSANYTAIANAIRGKTGLTGAFKPSEMGELIANIAAGAKVISGSFTPTSTSGSVTISGLPSAPKFLFVSISGMSSIKLSWYLITLYTDFSSSTPNFTRVSSAGGSCGQPTSFTYTTTFDENNNITIQVPSMQSIETTAYDYVVIL
jgi:hypothetical protein